MADERKPDLESVVIVIVGAFNPAIFQPMWLATHGLIAEEEAKAADIHIVHKEVSHFSTDWFSLQVTGDRLVVESGDPTKIHLLRDLVSGIFVLLEHTPITAFGFNRSFHFTMASVEQWHEFGHFYAPKEAWTAILDDPGLRTLVMWGKRPDTQNKTSIKVEPSLKIERGIFIHINEHRDLAPVGDDNRLRMRVLLEALSSQWDGFLSYCRNAYTHLFESVQKK